MSVAAAGLVAEPVVVAAVVVAAALGFISPRALAAVPEPADAHADKRPYRELAAVRGLAVASAAISAVVVAVLADRIRPAALLIWVFFVPLGVLLSYVDWHTRLLPKRLVIPGTAIVAGLALVVALIEHDLHVVVSSGISAAAVYGLFFVMWFIYPRGIGYGDVRLSGAVAMSLGVLGVAEVVVGLYAGFVIGAVCAVILAALRVVNARQFAFGPYLLLGAVLGAGWGPQLAALV